MLEAKVNEGIQLKATGSVMTIAIEINTIIRGVYGMIQDEAAKEAFKAVMQWGVKDESPTWKPDTKGHSQGVYMEVPADKEGRQG